MKIMKMKKFIKHLKKRKSHLMNPLKKKDLMDHIMLERKSMKNTLMERELLMKMRNW
jgi:hypothetical protein